VLHDKIAIVTGGASGIGQAICRGYARAGARAVVIADVAPADQTATMVQEAGSEAFVVQCDVSSEESVAELVGRTLLRFSQIDVLVNNAGIFPAGPIEEVSPATWDMVFAINARGTYLCTRSVLPAMKAARQGKIINIGSTIFFTGLPNQTAYAASKGAVIGFTRSLARELGHHNIHVNVITPGLVRTAGVAAIGVDSQFFASIASQQAFNRTGEPQDLVGAAVFLASAASDFITGQIINVDGGLFAH
jgi:3-oxoacyl-[acyl-carrier protein] reductase